MSIKEVLRPIFEPQSKAFSHQLKEALVVHSIFYVAARCLRLKNLLLSAPAFIAVVLSRATLSYCSENFKKPEPKTFFKNAITLKLVTLIDTYATYRIMEGVPNSLMFRGLTCLITHLDPFCSINPLIDKAGTYFLGNSVQKK